MQEKAPPILAVMFVDASAVKASASGADDDEEATLPGIEHCISELSLTLSRLSAMLLRSVGETLRCSFETPEQAMDAASALQEAMGAPGGPPPLRIGLHMGPVILRGDAYAGDAMKVAARMAVLAKPGQVICSPEIVEAVSARTRRDLAPLTEIAVTGVCVEGAPPHQLMRSRDAAQHGKFATRSVPLRCAKGETKPQPPAKGPRPAPGAAGPTPKRMRLLSNAGVMATLDARSSPFTLGRGKENDLACKGRFASRLHAEIIYSQGVFRLVDHSRHGTFLVMAGEPQVRHIHCESIVLDRSSGTIYAGCEPSDKDGDHISFQIEVEKQLFRP